jgi:hypothetical protein
MRVGEARAAVPGDGDHPGRAEHAVAGKRLGQRPAFHVLHHDERPTVGIVAEVVDPHQAGVAEPRRQLRLAQEAIPERTIVGQVVS